MKINIDELIRLHGFKRAGGDKDNIDFSKAIAVFKSLIDNNKLDEFFAKYEREIHQ